MNRYLCGVPAYLGLLLVAVPSQAQTIDFEALSTSGTDLVNTGSSTYQEDGYEVANVHPDGNRGLARWGTESSHYRGSTHILGQNNYDPLRLRKVDGGLFRLVSLKLTTLLIGQGSTTVEFTGKKSDNSTVSTTLVTTGPTPQTHFLPSTFDNLVSVSWSTGFSESWNQVDDLVVVASDSPASAVPEPSSALLFIPALGAVAVAVRRRQSSGEPVPVNEG